MKRPRPLPMALDPHRPPVKPPLGSAGGPAPPRLLQAIFPQVPPRPFHPPCPDRPAPRQVLVVAHGRLVPSGGAHRPPSHLPWCDRAQGGRPRGLHGRADGLHLASPPRRQGRASPRRARRMGLPQPGVGRVPPLRRGMPEVQDQGVRRNVGHHLGWARRGAIGARAARRQGGPVARGHPRRQTAHGRCRPCHSGPPLRADGSGAARRLRAARGLPQGSPPRLGAARVGGDGVEAGDDSFLLRGPLRPLAHAPGRRRGRRLHPRPPWASRWHHHDRRNGRRGRRLGGRLRDGRDLRPSLCHTGLAGLEAARHPPEAFAPGRARAGGCVRRPRDCPRPPQVGIALCRPAQPGGEGAAARGPRGGERMAPTAHRATHRIVSGQALRVIGQARPVGAGDQRGRTPGGPRDQEPPQQPRTPGQHPPEPGPRHRLGRWRPRVGARDVGQQGLKRVRQWLDHRLWVGSPHRSPWANGWVRRPIIAHGAVAFNSRRSPPANPYSVPQILVTLQSIGGQRALTLYTLGGPYGTSGVCSRQK
jgi:hypothetical protein